MITQQLEQNWISITGRPDLAGKLRRLMTEATKEEVQSLVEIQRTLLSNKTLLMNQEMSLKKLKRENQNLKQKVTQLTTQLRRK